jgi:hypothetical protein
MSMLSSPKTSALKTRELLIGALLRVPAQAIHRRIIQDLNAAGFDELRLPHIAVLQFPGPDGVRPGTLAVAGGGSEKGPYANPETALMLPCIVRPNAEIVVAALALESWFEPNSCATDAYACCAADVLLACRSGSDEVPCVAAPPPP